MRRRALFLTIVVVAGSGIIASRFLPEIVSAIGEKRALRVYELLPRKLVAFTLWASGRSTGCRLTDALAGSETRDTQLALQADMEASSRRIENASGFEHWTTPSGQFWVPAGSAGALMETLAQQARQHYEQPGHRVEAGDIVLDCGAAFGAFTRTALARGAKLVVAVEPSPANVECLKRNFTSEIAAGRVIVYPKGLWDTEGTLTMYLYGYSVLDSFVMRESFGNRPTRTMELPVTTIDRMVAELRLSHVDFIKMDVEGAEERALRGGSATIARFRPKLSIAAEHLPSDPERLPQVVRTIWAGYRQYPSRCKPRRSDLRLFPEVVFFQ